MTVLLPRVEVARGSMYKVREKTSKTNSPGYYFYKIVSCTLPDPNVPDICTVEKLTVSFGEAKV